MTSLLAFRKALEPHTFKAHYCRHFKYSIPFDKISFFNTYCFDCIHQYLFIHACVWYYTCKYYNN